MKSNLTRRNFLKLSGAVSATTVLAACVPAAPQADADGGAASSAEEAEVVMMYQANEISDAEIEQFNNDYDGITLTRVDSDATKFFADFAAGQSPDLLRTQAPDIPQLLARGILLDLAPFFETSEVLNLDDLAAINNYYVADDPTSIGQGSGRYGMAKDWAPDNFLWVNETVFETVGIDVPDFSEPMDSGEIAAIAEQLTTKEGDKFLTNGFNGHTGFIDRWWMMLAKDGGGSMFSEDLTEVNIVGNEAVEQAILFFHNMAPSGAMNSPVNPSPSWFGQDFMDGRLGMVYTGYWMHGSMVGVTDNEAFVEAMEADKIKMYPNFTWNGERNNRCITAAGAIASSQTQNPDATWTVFEWFMGKEPSVARASSGWGLPALKSQLELTPKEGPLSSQAWETIQDELDYAEDTLQFNPYLAGGEPMVPGQVFLQDWEQVLTGTMSEAELFAKIEEETNIALQEGLDRI